MTKEAAAQGVEIRSLHPMFGPEASVYGRNILICDCGSQTAMDKAALLFDRTGAKMTRIPVEEHDELMSSCWACPTP